MKTRCRAGALLVCFAFTASSSAPAAASDTRFDVVATGALGIDPNDRCEREASDVAGCSVPLVNTTFELSFEGRPLPLLGIGAFGGLSHLGTNEPETRDGVHLDGADDRMLRLGAELRLHPFGKSLPGAWVGATAGYAALYGSSDQRGALAGGSLGVDFTLIHWLLLGAGARVEYLALGSHDIIGQGLTVGDARYGSGVRVWIGARVGVTF
jgi:hypothetical protein